MQTEEIPIYEGGVVHTEPVFGAMNYYNINGMSQNN